MNAPVQPDLTGHVELPWHRSPLASYDCETTGTRIDVGRIVSAALIRANGDVTRWLSDVNGLEIPAAATAVHGITTEHAHAHGTPAKQVVEEIADALAGELSAGRAALVVMNAPFDLSLLDAECARHGVPTVANRIGAVQPVIDPLVLDRAADKYRRGRRNLESLAAHYGVDLTDAHTADADAQAALDVALRIAETHEKLQVPARILHGWQVQWHEAWAANYESFLRRSKPDATVDRGWPVRPVGGAS
ncbi:exonuclease domain-containing protein [Streptomyces sp. DSM 40750]|uniref:exonuclease domain-containing protein n=1 Tax=Streptomyces sp. DSM 40750 TaxID=2801030 RepID=UPI00214CF9F0|nr:exonuclease domain-containing protein [Streptomyces sp. DSM 40750]UUU21679.1 exonuclease domain-containing protein [Streptomyces sp. DSM 40750]